MRVVRLLIAGLAALALLMSAIAVAALETGAARTLVVQAGDVGAGYTAAPAVPRRSVFREIASCVGKPVSARRVVASATGQEFIDQATRVHIASSVHVWATKAMVRGDIAVLRDPNYSSCASKVGTEAGGSVLVVPYGYSLKKYGDFSNAIAVSAVGAYSIQIQIAKGRAEIQVGFFMPSDPGPSFEAKITAVLDSLNARIKQANP